MLAALNWQTSPILWALQGYLGGQSDKRFSPARDANNSARRLEREIVVGHRHYQQVINTEPTFRRVFAEVLRRRSMLFLDDERDLRFIADCCQRMLAVAAAHGQTRVHFGILAAGKAKSPWPPQFSLIQMVRGLRRFVEERRSCPAVEIHLVDPQVIYPIYDGRLDIEKLLVSEEIDLWVRLTAEEQLDQRQLIIARESDTIGEIAKRFAVAGKNWVFRVIPSPTANCALERVQDCSKLTLEDIGIVSGSTLEFQSRFLLRG